MSKWPSRGRLYAFRGVERNGTGSKLDAQGEAVRNYVQGEWRQSAATESLAVLNPATGEELGRTPLSPAAEVDAAVQAASRAFPGWRRVPVTERIQYLFKLKSLLEEHFEELARTITMECGKTLPSRAARCGAPSRTSRSPAARRS